jgi:hypothetical protein
MAILEIRSTALETGDQLVLYSKQWLLEISCVDVANSYQEKRRWGKSRWWLSASCCYRQSRINRFLLMEGANILATGYLRFDNNWDNYKRNCRSKFSKFPKRIWNFWESEILLKVEVVSIFPPNCCEKIILYPLVRLSSVRTLHGFLCFVYCEKSGFMASYSHVRNAWTPFFFKRSCWCCMQRILHRVTQLLAEITFDGSLLQ